MKQCETTKVLILAAGPNRRGWTDERPNWLAEIGGKPLVVRTCDQLREFGHEAVVVTHNKEVQKAVETYFTPEAHGAWSETLLSTRPLWADRTVVLHGDVIFSEKLLERILAEDRPLQFHGRRGDAFAVVFKRDAWPEVLAALETAIADYKAQTGARDDGLVWPFYRALCGWPLHPERHRDDKLYTRWTEQDYAQDLDAAWDYRKFLEEHAWARV